MGLQLKASGATGSHKEVQNMVSLARPISEGRKVIYERRGSHTGGFGETFNEWIITERSSQWGRGTAHPYAS